MKKKPTIFNDLENKELLNSQYWVLMDKKEKAYREYFTAKNKYVGLCSESKKIEIKILVIQRKFNGEKEGK